MQGSKRVERDFANVDEPTRTAVAFDTLANNGISLALLQRYETRYSRQCHRAPRALLDLQSRRTGEVVTLPPDPKIKDCRSNPPPPNQNPFNRLALPWLPRLPTASL